VTRQNSASRANSSQVARSEKLMKPKNFARRIKGCREADFRLGANRRLRPLGHLTVMNFPNDFSDPPMTDPIVQFVGQ
jgi:hypothetical protein